MAIHMVLLTEPNADVTARIKEQYVDCCHEITDTSYLVQTKELTQEVAVRAGVKGEGRIEDAFGVVFRLNGAYAGFAARSLWEWLGQAEETE